MNWLTNYKIPIGPWAKVVVDWLTTNLKLFFDFIALVLDGGITAMLFVLQGPFLKGTGLETIYPIFMILVFTGVAWLLRRSVGIAVFTFLGLLLILNQGYWKETMETLALVLAATTVSMVIGVPIGIAAARRPWLFAIIRPR